MNTNNSKACEDFALGNANGFTIFKENAPDTRGCKCTFIGNEKKSNAARLSVKTLMAMPPLLLGIVVPIVHTNLLRSY
uniref:Phage protein n=1 Tax=Globodera pallida TaxID=36090 RepID=A0A183BWA1_GLOPA